MKILFQMFCFLQNSYCPQTRFAKVMFSQVCICPLGGGGCLSHCMQGYTHTPRTRGRHPQGQKHPPPQADTPRARGTPQADTTAPGQTPPLGRHPPWADTSKQKTPPPPSSACFDTVTKQAVRIPLECILVDNVSLINRWTYLIYPVMSFLLSRL